MRRLPLLGVFCSLAAAMFLLAMPQSALSHVRQRVVVAPTEYVQGAIVKHDQNSLVLAAEEGDVPVRIADDAQITVDGVPATLDDLQVGQFAVVTVRSAGDELVAMQVDAGWR